MPVGALAKISLAVAILGYVSYGSIEEKRRGPVIGAVCRDGWRSNSTGRGTCSHHGGVARWVHAEYEGEYKSLRKPSLTVGHVGAVSTALFASIALVRLWKSPTGPPSTPSKNAGTAPKPLIDPVLGTCPRCKAPLVKRLRRRDRCPFIGCSAYPRCKYSRDCDRSQ
jgi:hypothetical protein